jgi:hypothetical protein
MVTYWRSYQKSVYIIRRPMKYMRPLKNAMLMLEKRNYTLKIHGFSLPHYAINTSYRKYNSLLHDTLFIK